MADSPALDLKWRSGRDADELLDVLHFALDDFSPVAIHEHESADGWRVFFRSAEQRDRAAESIATRFARELSEITRVDVEDEGWARRSQANLTAIRVGRIVVAPPWDDAAHLDALVVVIDPSTGFGTGHHETTRLCLTLLQALNVDGLRVIDVGTGSGVLAIAAARLGAASALAIDDDPEALRNAEDNVARNGVADVVSLRTADLASFEATPAAIVTANLTGAVLQRCAEQLRALVAPGGALIVSGFNSGEVEAVAQAFGDRVDRQVGEGDWAALLLRVTGSPTRS
ncbi:MAG TPA: 50S ribosomal protein L11 methyltransferase [Vicinamibacterales bacterium]|nr:50S ribosomal protein L11 methyltransferase [Vicinamibacterales bacterium]